MAQTCSGYVSGPNGTCGLTVSATNDAWTELLDNVSSLSLYKVFKGKVVNSYGLFYTAGSGQLRIRNTVTNQVKLLEAGNMPKGIHVTYIEKPFVVEENDIAEVYCTAAGT